MGNKFTRKLKFGSSADKDDKGAEGDASKKENAEAEPNAKAPSTNVDKKHDKKETGIKTEAKGGIDGETADTEDVKVTVPKEGGADIPKINIQDEEDDEVD